MNLSQQYIQSNLFRSYTPEQQLLLSCARTQTDSFLDENIQKLAYQKLEWSLILETATRHQVTSLLYKNLSKFSDKFLSTDPAFDSHKRHLYKQRCANIASSMILTYELLRLLRNFANESISIIPYKGAVLAAHVYKDSSLRQFSDLDFLIASTDMRRTEDFLLSQGYQVQDREQWEYTFTHPNTGITLDIHQGFGQDYFPLQFDFNHYIQHLQCVILSGHTVWSFSQEDLLIILAVQIVKDGHHHQLSLAKVCDIAELLSFEPAICWDQVIKQATLMGCQRLLLLALAVAHKLLGSALPQAILDMIEADWVVCQYSQLLCRSFFGEPFSHFSVSLLKGLVLFQYPMSSPHNKFLAKYILTHFWNKLNFL